MRYNSRMTRRIALVGTASSGVSAPYDDPSFEIWGVSARAAYVTRADRWFELHRLDGEPQDWADKWRETLRGFTHDVELLMLYPEANLGPRVTAYPHDRIVARFGTYFMTSTFSWMMALALDEMCPAGGNWEPGEIGLFGVDMEYGTEYRQQRAGLRHFIDMARVMGVTVTRLASGGLAYEPVPYPLWQDDPLLNKLALRNRETKDKLGRFDKSIRMTRTMIAQNQALIDEIEAVGKSGYDAAARVAALRKELAGLMETSSQLSRDIVHWEAVDAEQQWLDDFLQP